MDIIKELHINEADEKPLERLVSDGGFCKIFRTVGCIGDSLASGEHESVDENGKKSYHDYREHSWGQYMARDCGLTAYNFSEGGMTAREYNTHFASHIGAWETKKVCQAYIIALGVNDLYGANSDHVVGSVGDIDLSDWRKNKDTFAGHYGAIIQRLLEKEPKARFFFVTLPNEPGRYDLIDMRRGHSKLMYELAELFPYSYVIDIGKYGPVYDDEFKKLFFLGGHMNAAGYMLTAKLFESYIDYIVRHNMDDFKQIGFVGHDCHYIGEKW